MYINIRKTIVPLFYEKTPPTSDDVKLAPDSISAINEGDHDDIMVIFTVAQQDAYDFAKIIERNQNGNINLNEVRRGLVAAAESLTADYRRESYIKGVDSFIDHQLNRN